jgi:hypothetical protein
MSLAQLGLTAIFSALYRYQSSVIPADRSYIRLRHLATLLGPQAASGSCEKLYIYQHQRRAGDSMNIPTDANDHVNRKPILTLKFFCALPSTYF